VIVLRKYLELLKYEIKTLYKDSTNLFMIIYPFMMLALLAFLVPEIIKPANAETARIVLLIALSLSLMVGAYISGVLIGFSFIENKDENTILSIAVTPTSLSGYIMFKIVFAIIMSFFSNLLILGGLKLLASDHYVIIAGIKTIKLLDNLGWSKVLIFSFVSSLFVPAVALLFGTYAKNKIEGFAFLKGGALVIMLPVLTILKIFQNQFQYILGILPNFWPLKAMLNEATQSNDSSNLSYYGYMLIGIIYFALIFIFSFRNFRKRIHD